MSLTVHRLSINSIHKFGFCFMDTEPAVNSNFTTAPDENMGKTELLTLWALPRNSKLGAIWWFYSWPIRFVLAITLPNPRTCRKLYVVTFLFCILWIGVVAYLIFWMLVIIGKDNKKRKNIL